jgi:hypothetical protein
MAPKEKAGDLVNKYERYSNPYYYGPLINFGPHFSEEEKRKTAKQCALIAVDELINEASQKIHTQGRFMLSDKEYWQQVKQEIKKL